MHIFLHWGHFCHTIFSPSFDRKKHANVHFLGLLEMYTHGMNKLCVISWATRGFVWVIALFSADLKKNPIFYDSGQFFWSTKNCIFAKSFYCRYKIFSVQYCSVHIDMCAQFCGAWGKNDVNMDLRMSPCPVLCYGGTPKFEFFFSIMWSFWIFLVKKYLLLFLFSAWRIFYWTQLWKNIHLSLILRKI